MSKARCYHEFCCNAAVHHLRDFGQGKSGPFDPARPVYEYRGVFGFCSQHHEIPQRCWGCREEARA